MAALLVAGGMAGARAGDIDDAQLAHRCPSMAAWIKAHKAGAEADRKAHSPARPSQPALRAELLKMSDADQQARDAVNADGGKHPAPIRAMLAVDARNLPRIRQIDAGQGFPTPAQVGYDGVQAAWLLVQHADSDPAFQLHVLEELQARPDHGGVGAQDFTLLTDRVLVAQHKPQRYGTQFKMKDGELQPDSIEDPVNVDRRRAAAGLPPLADYACLLRSSYGLPAKS
jgi:hypothetical protein